MTNSKRHTALFEVLCKVALGAVAPGHRSHAVIMVRA